MKKFLGVILVLVCFITPAFAEPVSQEVLNQARTQAGLFMDLKNALGLEWLDEYNIYLTDPTGNPAPSWASSVDELINKNYLSVAFPTDFTISPTGKEVTISRTITNQGIKDALPIYLPSISISGDTVSLLVQRPAQWVAWEAGLLGKVSRDGSDDPDILPNSVLDFGEGSEIKFVNNDGKITGVDSLIYKAQELDDRFVNTSDDDEMSGTLTAGGFKVGNYIVWHEGNDGDGSGLDADLLDGLHGSYYLAAENLTGIVPAERLDGIYGIDISGNAATATFADRAHFAETIPDHTHGYVLKAGDTMTGTLTLQGTSINIQRPETSGGYARGIMFYSKDGSTVEAGIGMLGSGNNPPQTLYMGFGTSPWNSSAGLTVTPTNITFKNNKVWHAGNDGSGSGLDADMLDGKHGSSYVRKPIFIGAGTDLNDITDPGMYFFGGTPGIHGFTNIPPGQNSAFALLVEKTGAGIVQTYTTGDNLYPRTWKRTYSAPLNIWGQWYEEGKKLSNLVSTSFFGSQLGSGTFTWYKPSGVTHVIAYVWGSEEFPDEPNGVSSFGDYLYSTRWDEMATGVIDVTGVTSVPVTVADGEVIDMGGGSWRFYNGFVRVEGYSGPPQF